MVVLQLNRDAFYSDYSLEKDKDDRYSLTTSLLDAAVREYLGLCSEALGKPDPGASFLVIDRDDDEIIRAAGKRLMYTPANAGNSSEGPHGLFEAGNIISSLRYEGAEGIGKWYRFVCGVPGQLSLINLNQLFPILFIR